jgi:hypothetical protein
MFISGALGRNEHQRRAIIELADDNTSVTQMLHDPRLFEQAMRVPPVLLGISSHLYFYLFVYRALEDKGIADDDVADYVANVCVEFKSTERLWQGGSEEGKMIYFVDLLNLMNDLEPSHQFYLHQYIGNAALFLTGFFHRFIETRSAHSGAPALEYYEQMGKSEFGSAAQQGLQIDAEAALVMETLAQEFEQVRSALSRLAERRLKM